MSRIRGRVIAEPRQTRLFRNLQVPIVIDISSILAIVAAIGVIVGFVFTYLQLRNLAGTRRTELRWRIIESINSREFLEASMKVRDVESNDQKDFEKSMVLI